MGLGLTMLKARFDGDAGAVGGLVEADERVRGTIMFKK